MKTIMATHRLLTQQLHGLFLHVSLTGNYYYYLDLKAALEATADIW
jgi:hypothetical protein